jgi:predicted GNAT family acetyltransferase
LAGSHRCKLAGRRLQEPAHRPSELLLAGGRRHCFLFTDLSNPTSNHIYQAIGYRPVCDVDEYRFR